MRLKSELYKKEQDDIINKIINIMELETNNKYTLHQLNNDNEKQRKIMLLIPEIRKYFSFNGMKAVGCPEQIKRPWLSIVKILTKTKYRLDVKHIYLKENEETIRTQEYRFTKI